MIKILVLTDKDLTTGVEYNGTLSCFKLSLIDKILTAEVVQYKSDILKNRYGNIQINSNMLANQES